VRTGNAQGVTSSINKQTAVAALPAVNHPRTSAPIGQQKDKTADQLAALVKYSSRIANIDQPYVMGVGVNRKGPSSYANAKDKADRATNEQVLDPRTRIILFKMIGRGLIHEVNGCVSTGKEVDDFFFPFARFKPLASNFGFIGKCLSRHNTRICSSSTQNL
jgi:RIO kinase 1